MLRRMATNAVALALGGIVAQVVFVSIEIAIARTLGSSDYGLFSSVSAIALTSLFVIDLGTSWRLIESGSRNPESIAELLGTTVVLKFIGFLVLYPIVALAMSALGYDGRTVGFFLIFFGYTLTLAVQDSLAAVHTAHQRMVVNALFQGGTPLAIAAFVALALALGGGLNGVGLGYVAGGLLITGVWGVLTWRAERPRVRMAATGGILRSSYLYGLTGLLSQIFYKSDILLLSALTSMSQVGIYSAARKLLDLVYKFPILAARVVAPALFQQSRADVALYRSSADAYLRVTTAAGLLLAVASYPSADWLIGILFGDTYVGAGAVLRVLSASLALKGLVVALQTVLTTSDQHGLRTRALAIAATAAALGHWTLIPRMGVLGAALAVVGGDILLSMLYLGGIADHRLRTTLATRVATAGVAAAAGVAAPIVFGISGPTASTLGVLACCAMLAVTGYVRPAEVRLLWQQARSARGTTVNGTVGH